VSAAARVNAALVAPGATAAESALCYGAAAAGAVLAATGAAGAGLPPWPVAVLAVVAFDLVGGAVVNATPAASRRFHGPAGSDRRRLAFVAGHVHLFVLALTVPGFGWAAAALTYGLVLAGAVAVLAAPRPLRRPVAFAVTAVGGPAALLAAPVPAVLAWVTPVLMVKLLLGHLLPGERT
jgi:hypothetical protein